jgi:antitoxin VapB
MNMITTKTFKSGNSEAVRLPRDMAFGLDTEVEISKHGNVVTIRPKPKQSLAEMVAKLRALPKPDYIEVREPFDVPERPGL